MLLSFNWSRLDSIASESLRCLLSKKLKEAFLVPDASSSHQTSSSGGAQTTANAEVHGSNCSTAPPPTPPQPSRSSGPIRFETIEVSDVHWGQVPPFMELVHMDDGFDFTPPTPRQHHHHHHGSDGVKQAATHPHHHHATSSHHDGRLRRDASDCCISTTSSVTTHGGGGGGGGPDTGSCDATPRTQSGCADAQQDTDGTSSRSGGLSDIVRSLRAILGPNGLYLKLHLTYGGNMSVRVQCSLRIDAPLPAPTPHHQRGSPSTQGLAGVGGATTGGSVSPTTTIPRQGANHPPELFPATTQPSPTAHVLPVRLPLAFEVKHVGLDAYLHVNIYGSDISFWLEPASSLSESPITKLGLVAIVGADDDGTIDVARAAGSPGGQRAPRRGASLPQQKQAHPQLESAVFTDERLVAALVLEELKSILARHVVAPNCVTMSL